MKLHQKTWVGNFSRTLLILTIGLWNPFAAAEQEDPSLRWLTNIFEDRENARRCLYLRRLGQTEVLDDQNILFYMKGSQVYLNHLPHRCSGLRRAGAFLFRTSSNQICNVDMITKLGGSCRLGWFSPIEKDLARDLSALMN